jgi:hypothetical protein
MEQSLKTGVQPEAARSIVAPVIATFAGMACSLCGCGIEQGVEVWRMIKQMMKRHK